MFFHKLKVFCIPTVRKKVVRQMCLLPGTIHLELLTEWERQSTAFRKGNGVSAEIKVS